MYQTVIRDPGGDFPVRVCAVPGADGAAVTNGSILLVPPGTTAFAAVNGELSRPLPPGRYDLFTGVDPFFVRLRHVMTRGDPGVDVSVFFVSTQRDLFLQFGTGELPFCERRFRLTLNALAACHLTASVADPLKLLQTLLGTYRSSFCEEDLAPCIEQLVLAPVRETLSRELSGRDAAQFNSCLLELSGRCTPLVKQALERYGLCLRCFSVQAVRLPEPEAERLRRLEESFAETKSRTDLELDHLNRIWGGRVDRRTMAEMLTGLPSRGTAPAEGAAAPPGRRDDMTSAMMQAMLLSQILPSLREPIASMTQSADLFGGADAPAARPPLPARMRRCPECGAAVARNTPVCPVCGHRF